MAAGRESPVTDQRDEEVDAPDSALGYLVNHTASDFVVDTEGKWRLRHVFGSTAEEIVHDVRLLLQ